MNDADRNAVAFADELIEQQRPLWEQAALDLGIDINAHPLPGSLEEKMDKMSTEEFLSRLPRCGIEISEAQLKLI